MHPISAHQIKAARALLDWSQDDLATATGLSRATIRSVELGYAVRAGNILEIRQSLEINGIEFLEDDGVRRVPEGKRDYMGPDACDRFFEYMANSVKKSGGEIICHFDTKNMLTKMTGHNHKNNLQRLDDLNKIVPVRCMLSDSPTLALTLPSYEIRYCADRPTVLPTSAYTFDNQHAISYINHAHQFVFTVLREPLFVQRFINFFEKYWNGAQPIEQLNGSNKICA